jgi:hypothetical protein
MKKKKRLLDKPLKIYRRKSIARTLTGLSIIFFGNVALILAVLLKSPVVPDDSVVWGLLWSLLLMASLTLLLAISDRYYRYIAIYPSGFQYRSGAFSAFTIWDNLYYLDQVNVRDDYTYCIILKKLISVEIHGGLFGMLWYKIFSRPSKNNKLHLINIQSVVEVPHHFFKNKINIEKFVETAFGKDLKQYAPHVFEIEV